jgi:DNA repair protein RadA/Sms
LLFLASKLLNISKFNNTIFLCFYNLRHNFFNGLRLGIQDVFLNIAGGLKVEDPALDLAVCLAIASSFQDQIIPQAYCFAAEVGLGGEIRGVSRIEQRIIEADRLGFKRIFISKYNQKELDVKDFSIAVQPVATIQEAISYLVEP